MRSARHQRGQMLIGAVIATALFGILLASYVSWKRDAYYDGLANAQGSALAQYAVGLRAFIANVQSGSQPLPSNPYTVAGVTWLKPPTCGGLAANPTQGYVPCSFTGGPAGASYSTTVTQTPATNVIEARTWYIVPAYNGDAAMRGKMASNIVFAAHAQQTMPANGTFANYFANTPIAANAPVTAAAINPADRGRVLLVANNSPSNDAWLRVDGTNQMLADLNVGGHSLTNAKNGTFDKDLRVKGTAQVDNGMTVTSGTADLRGGAIAPDVAISSISRRASQAIYDAQVLTGSTSYTIAKPDCSQANLGSSSPAIYVSMQGTGSPAGQGDALYETHVQVQSSGSNWIITPIVETTKFTLSGSSNGSTIQVNLDKNVSTVSAQDQTILVLTKCK